MNQKNRIWVFLAPLLLILLSTCPAWAGVHDAKEGVHFTTVDLSVEGGEMKQVVRIHRHIVDTRQFATLLGTDMFRIRADNLTRTLALCHVGGPSPWRRKLVRQGFVEEDRASSEYWDKHCPDQAQRYVYMIPGEEIVIMTTQSVQENKPSKHEDMNSEIPEDSGAGATPSTVAISPQVSLTDQIAACHTPKCVWDLVSPIASNVTWPSAQPKPLPATNDAPSVSSLPMMMGTQIMWSDPLMADLHACTNLDCITATLRFASLLDAPLVQGTEDQSSHPVISHHEGQSVDTSSHREVMLETALTAQSLGFYLAVAIAFASCIMVLILSRRETNLRRYYEYELEKNDEDLRAENERLQGLLRKENEVLVHNAVEVNQVLTRLLNTCVDQGQRIELPETASTRERVTVLEQAIGSLRRQLYREVSVMVIGLNKKARPSIAADNMGTYQAMQASLIQDLRLAIRAYIDTMAEERDVALQQGVARVCRLIGVNHIASTEEGLQHLSVSLAWMSSEFARMWEETSIERVKCQGAENVAATYWVQYLASALPQIETMLNAYSAEVERLRTENICLRSGPLRQAANAGFSDWRSSLFASIDTMLSEYRRSLVITLDTPEQHQTLQLLINALFRKRIQIKEISGEVGEDVWFDVPEMVSSPSSRRIESVVPGTPNGKSS